MLSPEKYYTVKNNLETAKNKINLGKVIILPIAYQPVGKNI